MGGRLGTETLATEGSVARAAGDAGRVIFCLLPLAGDPSSVGTTIPTWPGLVEAHTISSWARPTGGHGWAAPGRRPPLPA